MLLRAQTVVRTVQRDFTHVGHAAAATASASSSSAATAAAAAVDGRTAGTSCSVVPSDSSTRHRRRRRRRRRINAERQQTTRRERRYGQRRIVDERYRRCHRRRRRGRRTAAAADRGRDRQTLTPTRNPYAQSQNEDYQLEQNSRQQSECAEYNKLLICKRNTRVVVYRVTRAGFANFPVCSKS